jgi:ATP-dependent Clp protease ATP-binding subunit ClpB
MRFEKLTTKLQQAFADAQTSAVQHDNPYIEPVHLLYAILAEDNAISTLALSKLGVNTAAFRSDLDSLIRALPKVSGNNGEINISRELSNLLNITEKISLKLHDSYVASEVFLLACFEENGSLSKLFKKYGINLHAAEQVVMQLRGGNRVDSDAAESKRDALKKYTIDLTEQARHGKLDPVIGRDDEIRRTIQVLQRRTKNNPVLIGEPGVGKTAIVEGLAQRIINDEVPDGLKGKKLLVLDLASMLAGAKYRGEFEERLKAVLKEIIQDLNTIIFIDEIHTIVGAGKADGAMDAGNMLKPALSRGELHCIGATTLDEYRTYIEKDPALERRFQKVLVQEPSIEDTIAILRGLQEKYEVHHAVDITDSAIIAAAELSQRYITDRFLPDKAIDLIDEAAAKIKMEIDSKPEIMDKLERRLIQLKIERESVNKETDDASKKRLVILASEIARLEREYSDLEELWKQDKSVVQSVNSIRDELDKLRNEIESHKRKGDWQKTAELQYGKLPALEAKLSQSESSGQKLHLLRTEVGATEIAEIVSRMTGIPIAKMLEGEKDKLLYMEDKLHERIIGQNEAVTVVSNVIRRSRSGLSDPNRPYGSFLFLGPTGVGKTELCKTLADFLFDSENHLVRIDMSEYMEKHSVARLVGAPPGYVGYEEGGYLTELVRRNPYSIVLLDEIEKAHSDIFNILLQVLDDGILTDGHGRTVNFKNTVIIMTSNIGSHQIQSMTHESHESIKSLIMDELKQYFKPEFINRIDEIVVFQGLSRDNIAKIADIALGVLQLRLAKLDLSLKYDDDLLMYLTEAGFDPVYGARPLKRALQQSIENPLAKILLEGKCQPGSIVVVSVQGGQIVFDISR